MRLYLSGGGSGEDSFQIDKMFAEAIPNGKPLLYIPIAIDTIKHPYPSCLKYLEGKFKPFNLTDIVMLTDLSKITKSEIEKFGGVYIGGGNTPKLLHEMRKTGFLEHLVYFAKNNVPLAGGSAGAIIFGKTITSSLKADSNDVGLTDFSSLNLTGDYEIFCHYEKSLDKLIKEFKSKYNMAKIVALPDNCGLFVNDDKIQVVGPGNAYLFKDKKKALKPGNFLP